MALLAYFLSALLAVALMAGLALVIRVLLDALALYHAAGMARVHHHTRETNQ